MSRSNSKNRQAPPRASMDKWLDREQSGFTGSFLKLPKGAAIMQVKEGKMLLDILPYVAGKGNPYAEEGAQWWERTFFVHRGIGPNSESYVCPAKTFNRPCPICEARHKLALSDDEDDEKLSKDLLPKKRQIFNIIDRKNPDKGVQILEISEFAFGSRITEEVNNSEEDEEGWRQFWWHDEGKTLRVAFNKESIGKGGSFLKAGSVHLKDREPYPDSILEETHPLDDILLEFSYKKLKEIFNSAAKDEDAEDDDDSDTEEEDDEDDDDEPKKKKKSSRASDDDDVEEEDDDDDEDSDDGDEDEPPVAKKKKKVIEEDDDDEEEEDSDDDDDDDEPASKKKKKSKDEDDDESDDDEDDSEEDDDSDEDDDDAQETPKGGKFRTASDKDMKRGKKNADARKAKSKDEDDDEEDREDFDSDDDEADDDDEDEKPAKKKKK